MLFLYKIYSKIKQIMINFIQGKLFKKKGKNLKIGQNSRFSYEKIELGNNVFIGENASFISGVANIKIGNNVMFGPHVTIRGGDHRIDVIGKYMIDVHEKLPENDKDVIIEDDVWIGCNVTILKGVKIGRGSVIGAGSVVTKSVEPYMIYTGVPQMRIRERFSKEEIIEHESLLQNY